MSLKEVCGQRSVITDLLGHGQSLGVRDGRQLLLPQLLDGLFLIPQIQLGPHQDDGSVGTVVPHLWIPLQEAIGGQEIKNGPVGNSTQGNLGQGLHFMVGVHKHQPEDQ